MKSKESEINKLKNHIIYCEGKLRMAEIGSAEKLLLLIEIEQHEIKLKKFLEK